MPDTQPILEAKNRDVESESPNELRQEALIPAVIYGKDTENKSIKVNKQDILPLLQEGTLSNVLVELELVGETSSRDVLIKEIQTDPVEDHLIHVDFHQVRPEDRVKIEVPVELTGQSPGVEFEDGVIDRPMRNIQVECEVREIPDSIEISIDELDVGEAIFISDVSVPSGIRILDHPEQAVVSIQPPKEFDLEPEPAAETELIEETVEEAMEEAVEGEESAEEVEAAEGEEVEEEVSSESSEDTTDQEFGDDL